MKYILKSMLQQAVAIHFEHQIPLILAYRRRYIKLSMKRIDYLQKEGIKTRFITFSATTQEKMTQLNLGESNRREVQIPSY